MLRQVVDRLIEGKHLQAEEAGGAITEILGGAPEALVGAFLCLLQAKGETSDELTGMAMALREQAVALPISEPILDIVGTGGDGAATVNLSTGAALLASACGALVAKHGNRSVSSRSGSADVLEALGVEITITVSQARAFLEERGFVFLFAPLFHPAMKAVSGARKALGRRTAFNLLGPLLNPASVDHVLLGVYDPKLMPIMAETLLKLGTVHSMVVHGQSLDEVTPLGPALALEIREGNIYQTQIDPKDFGIAPCELADLQGDDAPANAALLERAFRGESGPIADALALNAGVGLYLAGVVKQIAEGIAMAQEALKQGRAYEQLERCRRPLLQEKGVRL